MIAARYIFGNNKISGIASQLSVKTKGLASGILSDPHRMENIIGLVRTAAPLTSDKTVDKINTYLPLIEKLSTLLGMYAFLGRAQNYAPIQSLNAKTPIEKVSALVSNGNIPIAKLLAQPIIANNMDKIMSSAAKNLINSGNINEMMSALTKNFSTSKQSEDSSDNNIDINSLMETFMPIINNIMTENASVQSNSEMQTENNITINEPYEAVEINTNSNFQSESNIPTKKTDNNEIKKNSGKKSVPIHIRQRRRKIT